MRRRERAARDSIASLAHAAAVRHLPDALIRPPIPCSDRAGTYHTREVKITFGFMVVNNVYGSHSNFGSERTWNFTNSCLQRS